MADPTVFISYRHAYPGTQIADTVYKAFSAVKDGLGFELFMDTQIDPSDEFDEVILDGLNKTTHFVVLLDNDYWSSAYCRKELDHALRRWEDGENIRILFVKADEIRPEYMTFKAGNQVSAANSKEPRLKRVGQLQFLGPFSEERRLEALKYDDHRELRRQIATLIDALEKVLKKPR